MKIQSNMYINNPDMTSRNIEKKENSSHALVQEDDIQISDSARKLVETARNKVSDFHTMHFSSIMGEIRDCLLYTSPSPRDGLLYRMPYSA